MGYLRDEAPAVGGTATGRLAADAIVFHDLTMRGFWLASEDRFRRLLLIRRRVWVGSSSSASLSPRRAPFDTAEQPESRLQPLHKRSRTPLGRCECSVRQCVVT